MKFGDKLYELRKKNGYSQEELADKLGVSRQSVSKWESNSTYPETDKIIQIANLFDCSMDDLINDKITDVEGSLRRNKADNKNIWDSFLSFITDTVTMFSKMSFSQGFKCIIEFIILGLLLGVLGNIMCDIASGVISNIFHFLSTNTIHIIRETLDSIFNLVWFVIAIIIMVHTFKLRYLNNYQETIQEEKEKVKNATTENDPSNNKEKVKAETDKPFEFLSVLAKIVIFFIKFVAFFILIGFACASIGLIVASVLGIAFIPAHIIFLWITLLFISLSVIFIQIVILLINFIFNRKMKILPHVIVFVCSLVIVGISIGLIGVSVQKFEIIRDSNDLKLETEKIEVNYKNNLVIESDGDGLSNKYKYIIDNDMKDGNIVLSRNIDKRYFEIYTYEYSKDMMPVVQVVESNKNNFEFIKEIIFKNIKNNKIYTFEDYGNDPLVVRANENTINKLRDNLKKLYLIEEKKNNNEIDITVHEDRVYFYNGFDGEYNAVNDTIRYYDEDYRCKKEIEKTSYGDKIIYNCSWIEEEE